MTSPPTGPEELVREYEIKAAERERVYLIDAKAGNVLFDRMHVIAKQLRDTAEGRSAFEALILHPLDGVRVNAAAECLAWSSPAAIETLEEIERGLGLNSLTAKYVLKQYHDGTLKLDW